MFGFCFLRTLTLSRRSNYSQLSKKSPLSLNALDHICFLLNRSSDSAVKTNYTLKTVSRCLAEEYNHLPGLETLSNDISKRGEVIKTLASKLGNNHDQVFEAAKNYTAHAFDVDLSNQRALLTKKLADACTPVYEKMFDNILSENAKLGIRLFIEIREDLLQLLRIENDEETIAELKQLDASLKSLLTTWFSSEILCIRRITFETTSAAIIEKVAKKEAVHPLRSLDDLRARLGQDKRVYCAFHPLIPDEPLVFLHVALRNFQPSSMDHVLSTLNSEITTVATFYSISSTQPGLNGVALGRVLIGKATDLLKNELPSINTFITLSPIPRFRSWLQDKLRNLVEQDTFADTSILSEIDLQTLISIFCSSSNREAVICFLQKLDDPWTLMSLHSDDLEPILMRLAARYLALEKHRGKPLDSVARFHIQNGAELFRLNYMADTSRKGLHNSLGLMVNYHYNLQTLSENYERHAIDMSIPVKEEVEKIL